ncbi:MAG: DMT family transporter, partial [Anaerolineae bacterium]|nr:DMT family transporter [Anaerolineae bacterium]
MDKTIVSILGGLGGMFGWGISDFLANFSSDAIGHFKTFFWSQLAGMVLFLAVGVFLIPEFGITNAFYLALIVESGIAYALGYLFFYKAFEIGNVAIVSALINLQTIFVMVIAYALYGQRLSTYQYPAVLLLLVGVVLVSVDFGQLRKGAVSLVVGVKETVIAAVMFGILFWPVNEFLVERNDWLPINIYEKTVAIIFILLIAYIGKKSLSIGQTTAKTRINLIAVGLLEA